MNITYSVNNELDRETAKKLINIALNSGGDFADLYYEYSQNNIFTLEDGIIKNASERISLGLGIRVVRGEQTGYAYTEDLTFEKMKKAALTASSISKIKNKRNIENIDEKIKNNYYPISRPIEDLSISSKIEMIKEGEKSAFGYDQKIIKVNVNFAHTNKHILILNSEGNLLEDVRPLLWYSVSALAEKDGRRYLGTGKSGGRVGLEYFTDISPSDIGKKAARQAITMLDAIDAPAGGMEVVLAAAESGVLLHEAVGHPLEGDFNRIGNSAYSGRIGQKVASELCTVIDNGKISNNSGALNFDDEGNPTKENVLIEKGRLVGYMHDRISANYFKVEPTGNGRRESYQYHPIPRMTTTYMPNGKHDPEEIIKSVKKGIYCMTFSGGQVDISNGDFVFVPSEAYLIENGIITRPIKNLTLIGNGPDVLTKVVMVGNDFKFSDGVWWCGKGQTVPVGIGLPMVKISEITVGGSSI
jgi:TldD protein